MSTRLGDGVTRNSLKASYVKLLRHMLKSCLKNSDIAFSRPSDKTGSSDVSYKNNCKKYDNYNRNGIKDVEKSPYLKAEADERAYNDGGVHNVPQVAQIRARVEQHAEVDDLQQHLHSEYTGKRIVEVVQDLIPKNDENLQPLVSYY